MAYKNVYIWNNIYTRVSMQINCWGTIWQYCQSPYLSGGLVVRADLCGGVRISCGDGMKLAAETLDGVKLLGVIPANDWKVEELLADNEDGSCTCPRLLWRRCGMIYTESLSSAELSVSDDDSEWVNSWVFFTCLETGEVHVLE
jgi:hypothetical protein